MLKYVFTIMLLICSTIALAASPTEQTISLDNERLKVTFTYPITGNAIIDADILEWANQAIDSFKTEAAEVIDDKQYELICTYEIVKVNDSLLTVIWNLWSYTGGAHGNLDISPFIYNNKSGAILDLKNLFADEQNAMNIFSSISYTKLSQSLGDMLNKEMLRSGTTPDIDNFSAIVPTQTGVSIYFQPYQVAPWAAGPQKVEIDLNELKEASPYMELWEVKP